MREAPKSRILSIIRSRGGYRPDTRRHQGTGPGPGDRDEEELGDDCVEGFLVLFCMGEDGVLI